MPEEMAVLIDRMADDLGVVADDAGELIVAMGVAEVQLRDGVALLDQYRTTISDATGRLEEYRAGLAGDSDAERSALAWLGAAVALAQLPVFGVGLWLLVRRLPAGREDDRAPESGV